MAPPLQKLKGRHLHHTFPFNYCFRDMHMDAKLVSRLRMWTLQFVYLRPIISVMAVYLQVCVGGWLGEVQQHASHEKHVHTHRWLSTRR